MTLYEQLQIVRNNAYTQPMGHQHLHLMKDWNTRGEMLVYYNTAIVKAFEDGSFTLDNGGYWTRSTQAYMNEQLSRIGFQVIGKCSIEKKPCSDTWQLLAPDSVTFAYENDMTVHPDTQDGITIYYASGEKEVVGI